MRYLQLLRRPGPLLLWIGQVTSTAGDRLDMMAMLWLTYQLTNSTRAMAGVSLAETVPLVIIGLLGGALVDRWDRLRTMIVVDLLRAAIVLALPLIWVTGRLAVWHLAAVSLAMGGLGALFDPALQAALPALVSRAEFPGLAGLMDTPSRIARLVGPGFAGVLLQAMPVVHFFTLDGASFLVSAACMALIARLTAGARTAPVPAPARRRDLLREVPIGWRLVRASRPLLTIFTVDILGNVGWAAYSLGALVLVNTRLHGGAGAYGLLIAFYGVGSLVGNLLVGNMDRPAWQVPLATGGWAGIGLGFVLMALSPTLPWALGAVALSGIAGSMAHVSRAVYIGQTVPGEHLGKVHSLRRLATSVAGTAGTLLLGWLLDRQPPVPVIAGTGLALMAVSGTALALTLAGRRATPAPDFTT